MQFFPAYANLRLSVFCQAMQKPTRQNKLTVVWEVLPDADPEAIHKAFRILFRAAFRDPTKGQEHAKNTPQLDKSR